MTALTPAQNLVIYAKRRLIGRALGQVSPGSGVKITAEQERDELIEQLLVEGLFKRGIEGLDNVGVCFIGATEEERETWGTKVPWESSDHLRISFDVDQAISWRNKKTAEETGFKAYQTGSQVPVIVGVFLDADRVGRATSLLHVLRGYQPDAVLEEMLLMKGERHGGSSGYATARQLLYCWPDAPEMLMDLEEWGEFLCVVFPDGGGGVPTDGDVYENMWRLGLFMDREVRGWDDQSPRRKITKQLSDNFKLLKRMRAWSRGTKEAVARWHKDGFHPPDTTPPGLNAEEVALLEGSKAERGKVQRLLKALGAGSPRSSELKTLSSRQPVDLSRQLVEAILRCPPKPSEKTHDAEQLFVLFPFSHAGSLLAPDEYRSPECVFQSVWKEVEEKLSQQDSAASGDGDGEPPDLEKLRAAANELKGEVAWPGRGAGFKWKLTYNKRYLSLLRMWGNMGRTLSGDIKGEVRLVNFQELAYDSMEPKSWRGELEALGFLDADDRFIENPLQDTGAPAEERYFHQLAQHLYTAFKAREEIYAKPGLYELLLVAPVIAGYEGAPFSALLRTYYDELRSAFLLASEKRGYFEDQNSDVYERLQRCLRDIEVYATSELGEKQGYMVLGALNPLKLWTYMEFGSGYTKYLSLLGEREDEERLVAEPGEPDGGEDADPQEEEGAEEEVATPADLQIVRCLKGDDLARFRDFLGESVFRLSPPHKTLRTEERAEYMYDGAVPECRGGAIFTEQPIALTQGDLHFWRKLLDRIRRTIPVLSGGLKLSIYADSNPALLLKALMENIKERGGFRRVGLSIHTSSRDLNLTHGLKDEDGQSLNNLFGYLGYHRQLSCHTGSSVEDWVRSVQEDPPHLAVFLSLSPPKSTNIARITSLDVHPCVVPMLYHFNPTHADDPSGGSIEALSATDDLHGYDPDHAGSIGMMSSYMDVHNSLGGISRRKAIKIRLEDAIEQDELESVIDSSLWSVFVRPAGERRKPAGTAILWSQELEKGEVEFQVMASWTRPIELLLEQVRSPLADELTLAKISRYTEGVASLLGENLDSTATQSKLKGTLGAVLAADSIEHQGLLTDAPEEPTIVFSVDRKEHMRWLGLKGPANERCDLVSISAKDGQLVVHAIEVKYTDARPWKEESGNQVSGKAVSQALATRGSLRELFLADQFAALPRLEVLQALLVRRLVADLSEGERREQQKNIGEFLEIVGETLHDPSRRQNCEVIPVVCWVSKDADKIQRLPVEFMPEDLDDYGQMGMVIELPDNGKEAAVSGALLSLGGTQGGGDDDVGGDGTGGEAAGGEDAGDDGSGGEEIGGEEIGGEDAGDDGSGDEEADGEDAGDEDAGGDEIVNEGIGRDGASAPSPGGFEAKLSMAPADLDDIYKKLKRVFTNHKVPFMDLDSGNFRMGPTLVRCLYTLKAGESASKVEKAAADIGRELKLPSDPVVGRQYGTDFLYLDYPRSDQVDIGHSEFTDIFSAKAGASFGQPDRLPFILGLTPDGRFEVADLAELPHMAIGGTTGSGKSVFLLGIFYDLISTHTDDTLQLYVVDPKQVDFHWMEGLPCVREVLTDIDDVLQLLQRVVEQEIEGRKKLYRETGPHVKKLSDLLEEKGEAPPSIVIAIDEFRDLMDEIEDDKDRRAIFVNGIRRIAQTGRAFGVHLVLATQRPDKDAIPKNIQANIPGRACLKVGDHIASNMIIGTSDGAKLLGRGDMLFKGAQGQILRVQVPFIEPADLEKLRPNS